MVITDPGKVTERVTLLGSLESCVYLVDGGEESVLLGGGLSYIVPGLLRQIGNFNIDEKKISRMVILHAHFDHCGVIPFFKKRWPWAKVVASRRAAELLSDEKISASIASLNEAAIRRAGLEDLSRDLGFGFTGIEVEETVGEGDLIPCGDLTLEVMEVPGHSTCSIALYMPREKVLFPSDSAGIKYQDFFLAAGNSNFDLYEKGLVKMARYDVEAVLGEHYGGVTGEEAREFLPLSMEAARKTRVLVEETYRRVRDINACAEELTRIFRAQAPDYFLDPGMLALVFGQMVRYFAKILDG
ncbi:MAG: MBL fold metallo-hydrolase [Deltaproteobacteria bacterium]|nr:MBL fold metallo-hydrolase [Deltaproteobacteria bacterium]